MRWVCRFFARFAVFAIAIAARAEEGGFGHYAPGSFASFIDVLPGKPSLGAFNYFTYYNGSAGVTRQFEIAGRIAANVSATSYARRGVGFLSDRGRSGPIASPNALVIHL